MKKIHYLLFIAASIAISSCASDNQDPVSPSTDLRDNFVAYWNVIENSTTIGGQTTFVVNVAKSTTNSNEIILNNFSGLSQSARASVSNNNITIPYQQIGTVGFTQGSGTLTNANTMSLTYTNTIGATAADNCTAVFTKQ
jgi:hypothetical protein